MITPTGVFACISIALFLKSWALTWVQGYNRIKHRAFVRPEDALHFGQGAAPRQAELPVVERAAGALRNDAENAPFFLATLGAACALGGEVAWLGGLGAVFVLARAVHSAAYLAARQPLRNRAYIVGLLTQLVLIGYILTLVLDGA